MNKTTRQYGRIYKSNKKQSAPRPKGTGLHASPLGIADPMRVSRTLRYWEAFKSYLQMRSQFVALEPNG